MGDYDVSSQIATLTGNVQATRGKNKLSGDKAIVNLATGVSKIIGGKSARVRTILYPGGGKGDVPNRADAGTNGKRQDKNNPTDDVSSGEPGQRADERKDDPATPPKDSNTDQQTAPMAFVVGASMASVGWFFGLVGGAGWLAPRLAEPRYWQAIEGVICGILLLVAWQLATTPLGAA